MNLSAREWGYCIPDTSRVIDCIIVHSSYNPVKNDTFNTQAIIGLWRRYDVSPHYFVTRSGRVLQLVKDEHIAYHAGRSRIPGTNRTNLNGNSIGIEVASTPTQGPTSAQYDALLKLVRRLKQKYEIRYVLRHSDVAPDRKTDPWGFDWEWFMRRVEEGEK